MEYEPLSQSPELLSEGLFPYPSHVAMLGNFPPRRCGLATYTFDSYDALRKLPDPPRVDVYAMDDGQVEGYPSDICMLIPDQDRAAYLRAADAINASGAEILWIQHEYGIFGGDAGSHLLSLIDHLTIPFAVTFHTVLENPNPAQKRVMAQLLSRAAASVVMAQKGVEILRKQHPAAMTARLSTIPHGIPDLAYIEPAKAKAALGIANRPTVLTFGLLSPDKGIEDMIEALPAIREQCSNVHYVVLGATHPHLKRREGEAFRESMMARVGELALEDTVTFVDRFAEFDELAEWLAAADVYVTPYRNPAQITSGTLSYAIGLGKPVVSTPYVHATEILADGHGVLVPFRSPLDLAAAVSDLLAHDAERLALAGRAYTLGRSMIWPRNAEAVMNAMARGLANPPASVEPVMIKPVLRLSPVERLTDGTGMLQHSIYGIVDRDHGYCIDDNARALMLMALADDITLDKRLALSSVYASFVQHAWNDDSGCFRNFMAFDRSWLEDQGSEDSNGRTLWALGVAARHAPILAQRQWAAKMFDETVVPLSRLAAPRARAFSMLGAAEMLQAHPDHREANIVLRNGACELLSLLHHSRRPDWSWFEIVLSYDNTRLPEALIRAGLLLGNRDYIAHGIETLEWVGEQTLTVAGRFQPVGTESFGESFAPPAMFDQQPLEAWAMIDACAAAWKATADRRWIERATVAHDWFLGANVLGQTLVDPVTGECHDGLTPLGVNMNHGAESVLAWQFAHRQYRALLRAAQAPVEDMEAAEAA